MTGSSDALKLIAERLEDLEKANTAYRNLARWTQPEEQRNDREIWWLKELRSTLLTSAPTLPGEIKEAARAVIDRWDTPNWKDAPATAVVINRLRAALSSQPVVGVDQK